MEASWVALELELLELDLECVSSIGTGVVLKCGCQGPIGVIGPTR
jgi:hypothetical protein